MSNRTFTFLALPALLLIAACNQDTPTPDDATPAARSDRSAELLDERSPDHPGALVFEENCAICHRGQDPHAPHQDMLQFMSPASILTALTDGAMVMQAEMLSDDQRIAVSEYLANRAIADATADFPLPVCEGESAAFDYNDPPAWPGWGLTRGNTRHVEAALAGIDRDNVKNLKLKWAFALPDAARVRSQPMPAGGAVHLGSHNGTVFALDRETGCVRWSFRAAAEVRTGIVISPWTAGDTNAEPVAYFGDLVGYVYAIDARDGSLIWRIRGDDHANTTITGTPTLYEDRLYVPVSSLEVVSAVDGTYECCTFRGSVVAVDAASGEQIWRAYTISETPKVTGQNNRGANLRGPSGAPVWNSPAVDEERRQIYFGTGQNYSSPATGTSDSIFAVDMDNGRVNWVYQATPEDAWNSACEVGDGANCPAEDGPDVDFGAGATYSPGAGENGLVVAGQKSGVVHALDPDTGEVVWKRRLGRGGLTGGIHFGLAAGDGRVYAPISDADDGKSYTLSPSPGLYALDIETGDMIWETPMADRCEGRRFCFPGISNAITATQDLVFTIGLDSWVRVYDTAGGQILWEHDTARKVMTVSGEEGQGGSMSGGAGPIPHRGMLYISSGYGFSGFMPGNLFLAFEVAD